MTRCDILRDHFIENYQIAASHFNFDYLALSNDSLERQRSFCSLENRYFETRIQEVRLSERWFGVTLITEERLANNFINEINNVLIENEFEAIELKNDEYSSNDTGLNELYVATKNDKLKISMAWQIT